LEEDGNADASPMEVYSPLSSIDRANVEQQYANVPPELLTAWDEDDL
jgi:hypothetical protein